MKIFFVAVAAVLFFYVIDFVFEKIKRARFERSRIAPMPELVRFKPLPSPPKLLYGEEIECGICDNRTSTPFHHDPRLRWMVDAALPTPNDLGPGGSSIDKITLCPACTRREFGLDDEWYENLASTEETVRKSQRREVR